MPEKASPRLAFFIRRHPWRSPCRANAAALFKKVPDLFVILLNLEKIHTNAT
jgi:hypothetical protein